jgi:hypothetical protein
MQCNKIKRINAKNVSFFEMIIIVFEASLSTTRFTFGNNQVRGTFIAHLYTYTYFPSLLSLMAYSDHLSNENISVYSLFFVSQYHSNHYQQALPPTGTLYQLNSRVT